MAISVLFSIYLLADRQELIWLYEVVFWLLRFLYEL